MEQTLEENTLNINGSAFLFSFKSSICSTEESGMLVNFILYLREAQLTNKLNMSKIMGILK